MLFGYVGGDTPCCRGSNDATTEDYRRLAILIGPPALSGFHLSKGRASSVWTHGPMDSFHCGVRSKRLGTRTPNGRSGLRFCRSSVQSLDSRCSSNRRCGRSHPPLVFEPSLRGRSLKSLCTPGLRGSHSFLTSYLRRGRGLHLKQSNRSFSFPPPSAPHRGLVAFRTRLGFRALCGMGTGKGRAHQVPQTKRCRLQPEFGGESPEASAQDMLIYFHDDIIYIY